MKRISQHVIWIFVFANLMTACAMFKTSKEEDRKAVCRQLKHEIIWNGSNGSQELWNGATGNPMLATQQRAETEILTKNYHDEGC